MGKRSCMMKRSGDFFYDQFSIKMHAKQCLNKYYSYKDDEFITRQRKNAAREQSRYRIPPEFVKSMKYIK